jgi:hypothetical protein
MVRVRVVIFRVDSEVYGRINGRINGRAYSVIRTA